MDNIAIKITSTDGSYTLETNVTQKSEMNINLVSNGIHNTCVTLDQDTHCIDPKGEPITIDAFENNLPRYSMDCLWNGKKYQCSRQYQCTYTTSHTTPISFPYNLSTNPSCNSN